MDDDFQVIPNKDEREEERYSRSFGKRLAFAVFGLLLFSSIGAGAYYMGKRSVQGVATEISETSTPLPSLTATAIPTMDLETTPSNPSSSPKPSKGISPSTFQKTNVLKYSPLSSGSVTSDGLVLAKTDIKLGRDEAQVYRGFVSFDLSGLASGVQIGKATLRLYQTKIEGKPFAEMGAIKVDHLTYGDSLDQNDYALAALTSNFATIPQGTLSEWKEIDVTSRVKSDLSNARSFSQYRIHFTTEKSSTETTNDFLYFDASLNTPQLVISY